MAIPSFIPKLPNAPSVPRNRSVGDIFKPKTSQVPSVTGQGKVDAPRIQMLIENYRTNPNGVRNMYLNMPEDAQMNLLMELAEEFPPARPQNQKVVNGEPVFEPDTGKPVMEGDPISNVGMELFQFLTEGDGVADSSVRRGVLMRDNRDGGRPGPSTTQQDSFTTGEARDKKLGSTGDEFGDTRTTQETDEFLDNPEPTGFIDKSTPDNPQNRYRNSANAAAELGYTKRGLPEGENFRPTERVATVEDGQPTNQSVPETGRASDAADMERSPAGQRYARGQIDRNAGTKYPDMVAEKDNSNYFNSYQKEIGGLMNNSRNPDALGGNRIDQLWTLISKTGDDPRTLFGSPEAMADVMMGYVSPKMIDNMTNPSPIGQQLPASLRSKKSFELIHEQLVKQIKQRYANADGTGFGAADAASLSKPSPMLDPDGVNNLDANLENASSSDLDPLPESNYSPDKTGRLDAAEANQQDRFDIFQERMDELMAEGLSLDEVVQVMEDEGLGQEWLKSGINTVESVNRYGREMPLPPPPLSVNAAKEKAIGAMGPQKTAEQAPSVNGEMPKPTRQQGPLPPPPVSVRAAKEKVIGARGPQKTAEQAPSVNKQANGTIPEPPPPPTLKKGLEQKPTMDMKEAIGILRMDGIDPTGMKPADILAEAEAIKINRSANGPVPPPNTNKTPSEGEVGPTFTEDELQRISRGEAYVDGGKVVDGKPKDNNGDLDTTSESNPIDNNDSAATDLPPDDQVPVTPDGTVKPETGTPEVTVNPETDKPGFLGKGSTSRKVAGWTGTGGIVAGLGALGLSGTKTVNVPPDDSMAPSGDELAPSEVLVGMGPNGGFERDADGSLSAAGLHAFLEKGRQYRASRPSINTGTQTMGNWVR